MTETSRAPQIVTHGTGHEERTGDQADFALRFAGRGRNAAAATAQLGQRVTVAEGALAAPGLAVRHRRVWVSDDWRGNEVIGCAATEEIRIRFTDLDRLDEVLAALLAAQPEHLDGPEWLLADPSVLVREAQRHAVADARARAEGYAAAAGGRLGPLRRIVDSEIHMVERTSLAAAAEGAPGRPDVADLRLEPEPVRVTVRCTTTWELLL